MDKTQFGILIAMLGTFGSGIIGVIRWAVGRLANALDANTASHLESAKAMTAMSTKLDFVYGVSREMKDEISGVHERVDLDEIEEETPVEKPRKQQRESPRPGTYFHVSNRKQTKG